MNAKLESFINQKRTEHLISLGLVDESKPIKKRKYTDVYQAGYHLDNVKNLYYTEVTEYEPIDITNEEYQELLKYAPIHKDANNNKGEDNVEKVTEYSNTIKTISNILFVVNLIVGIIGLIMLFNSDDFVTGITSAIIFVYALFGALYTPIISGFANIVAFAEKNINLK